MAVFLLFVAFSLFQTPIDARKASYIVYLGDHSHGPSPTSADYELAKNSHTELLGSILGGPEKAKEAIVHSYTKNINAFAAILDEKEADELSKYPGVISVFPNTKKKLHTTHSWDFLGMESRGRIPHNSIWPESSFGRDIIIANFDTGVWPESQSFGDDKMGPVPRRWKGYCQNNTDEGVRCNKKLIGARYFNQGPRLEDPKVNSTFYTPRDVEGHGTHTLSTAGGFFVPNANFFYQANGTAKGGSPGARVASYKVCWPAITQDDGGCYDIDLLSAFEAAIHDGVDVISLSVGGALKDYFEDSIGIGSFHAVRRGISVVCSAGNSGPEPGTVSNVAPWILTVGASTTDRDFLSRLTIGNGKTLEGRSLAHGKLEANQMYHMVKSEDVGATGVSKNYSHLCFQGSLDSEKVKGKIVVCARGIVARVDKAREVQRAGGAGMVLVNVVNDTTSEGGELFADPNHFPTIHIGFSEGKILYSYLNSSRSPLGSISPAKTVYGTKPNPRSALFTSRGPNLLTTQILKPDVTAPGVEILASVSQAPNLADPDVGLPAFNLMSGTSMACPHVAGVVGLLKSLHPRWTPGMIRSAIMTTATDRDNEGGLIKDELFQATDPFSYGAGHIRPNLATNPGLVYDLRNKHYKHFLCALGYNATEMKTFSVRPHLCHHNPNKIMNMNNPSITIPHFRKRATVSRILTNVGKPSVYKVQVEAPKGFAVSVRPAKMRFKTSGERRKFKVTVKARDIVGKGYQFGSLVWSDGKHNVRSPIVVQSVV